MTDRNKTRLKERLEEKLSKTEWLPFKQTGKNKLKI